MKKQLKFLVLICSSLVLYSCASIDRSGIDTQSQKNDRQETPSESSKKPEETKNINEKVIAINNQEPEGEIYTLESFEDGNFWYGEGEENPELDSAFSASLSEDWFTAGAYSGKWEFKTTSSNHHASFITDAPIISNWTDVKYLVADINNTSNSVISLKLKIITNDGNFTDIYETQSINLGIGHNTNVIYDLTHDLKLNNQTTNVIIDAESIYKVVFEITNTTKGGVIYIDSIRLVK